MSDEKCKHATIGFGSGGWYIFCAHCRAIWVPEEADSAGFCTTSAMIDGDLRVEEDGESKRE